MTSRGISEAADLFERHRRDVYGWAYRLLGRHHDAQDAAQDVFLRWLAQSRRALPENPRGWLRQVTANRAIDLLRRRRPDEFGVELSRLPAPSAGLADAERGELRGAVVAALDRLTDAQRTVLIAKTYDGLTFAQIAVEQKLSVSTVKTHYLRGLARLRDALVKSWVPNGRQA